MKNKTINFETSEITLIEDILYFGSTITHAGEYFLDKNQNKIDLQINLYIEISKSFLETVKKTNELPNDLFMFTKIALENAFDNLGEELDTVTPYSKKEVEAVLNKFDI